MVTVLDILAVKGNTIIAIGPDATVYEAAVKMNRDKIGALVVLDDDRLIGIITERDILRRVVAELRDPGTTLVADVMTTELICGQVQTSFDEARGVMKNRRIRHLPIVDDLRR